MVKSFHIDLFMPNDSQYRVLYHFTVELFEALQRSGQNCRLLTLDKTNPQKFFNTLTETPADFTLTFNAIEPSGQNQFLSDILKIPHFSYLVDSPANLFSLIKGSIDTLENTRYSIMSFPDKDACNIMEEIGFSKVFFLPHGVSKNLHGEPAANRPFDVTILESFIDPDMIINEWKEQLSPTVAQLLMDCVDRSLLLPHVSDLRIYAQAFNLVDSDGHLLPEIVLHHKILNELEMCVRGIDRIKLAQSVHSATLNLFGDGVGNPWKRKLGNRSNIKFYPTISFDEAIMTMKKSKIVLNSCSWIRDGGHERLFTAMACGALVISTRTPYLEEQFTENEEILFYDLNEWEKIDDLVNYYLSHDREREEIARKGQKKVLESHTWDARAQTLISSIDLTG